MQPTARRRTTFLAVALAGVLALLLTACGDDSDSSSGDGDGGGSGTKVVIADQGFGESKIAAQLYGQVLAAKGYDVSYRSLKDRQATFAAFESGDINFEPDYAASSLEFLNGNAGEASPDIDTTVEKFQAQLEGKGLRALDASKAVDTNSLVVTEETAKDKGLSKISDLTPDLRLGGPQDCPTNAGCIPALQTTYGIDLSENFVPLDASGPNTKSALENGDIDVAVLFSTDAGIAANGWKVLTDDKGIFNADNIIPVTTDALAADDDLVELVNEVSAALTTEKITALNKRFDIDKDDADAIAEDFLRDEGLL